MIETRFMDRDPLSGSTLLYHFDHADRTFTYEDIEDVEPIIERNKMEHNDRTDANWKGDWHQVARLPLSIWFKLKKAGILDDKPAMKRWLNDPDNSGFRVRPGHV